MIERKRCLITGCCGLIGTHLIRRLARDYQLILCSRNVHRIIGLPKEGNHVLLEGDLRNPNLYPLLPRSVDHVIHLAQSEHFRCFPDKAEEVFDVNVTSTLRLLEYARQVQAKSVILASSGLVYGNSNGVFSEDEGLTIKSGGDLGFYYTTKLCVEALAKNYISHLNVILLRFFFVYGPGQKKSMLIPRLIHRVMDGQAITLQGEEGLKINPIYVEDAVEAIYGAIQLNGSDTINVAGQELLTLKAIGNTIGEVLNQTPVFQPNIGSTGYTEFIANTDKMSQLLGHPKYTFKQGIEFYIRSIFSQEVALSS